MLNIVFKLFMESTMSGPVSYYSINLKAFKITGDPINLNLLFYLCRMFTPDFNRGAP